MKKLSYLLLAGITSVIFNSCTKDDEGAKPISLTTEKIQYAPYEIVTITSSVNLFNSKSFVAKINDVEVMVGTDENIASFILPNLPDGNYDVIFSVNENKYSVPINVKALSNILSADQYFNEIQSDINQNINDLNSQITQLEQNSSNPNEYENLKNDVFKYTNLLNDYTTSYNNLSDIDKQEFAKTMAANKALGDEYNQLIITLNSSTSSLRTAQSVQDYEAKVEAASLTFYSCINEIAQQIPYIVAGAIIAKTPIHPIINAGAILATGILVASFMVNVDKTITAAITLTDKSIKPFEFITQTDDMLYDSGVETDSDNQIRYRSLINSDSNSQGNRVSANNTAGNGSTITTIAQKYIFFKDKYNNFINELPSLFRPSYIMTSLKNTYKSTSRSINNKYVNITNISNPQVKLVQINQPDGSIKIKATTTATSDQIFTYDVNYTNTNFASGLKKTVRAKVLPGNSYNGEWILESLSGEVSGASYNYYFSSSCNASRDIWVFGGSTLNISNGIGTINIVEHSGKYIIYENCIGYSPSSIIVDFKFSSDCSVSGNFMTINRYNETKICAIELESSNNLKMTIPSSKSFLKDEILRFKRK